MRKFLKRRAHTAPRHGFASRAMRHSGVESVLIRGFRTGILILMWLRRVKVRGFHGVKTELDGHSVSDLYTQSHLTVARVSCGARSEFPSLHSGSGLCSLPVSISQPSRVCGFSTARIFDTHGALFPQHYHGEGTMVPVSINICVDRDDSARGRYRGRIRLIADNTNVPINPQIACPHRNTTGRVRTKTITQMKVISAARRRPPSSPLAFHCW